MSWLVPAVLSLEVLLLVYAAATDIATRIIPNEVCLLLAVLGVASQIFSPAQVAESLVAAAVLFLILVVVHRRGWMGGGDVKLLVAVAIGLPLAGVAQFMTVTALAGGVLALAHLAMRCLPRPRRAPAGAPLIRRVYAVERWRNLRRAPLPYGAAIACGGVWAVLQRGF